MSFDWAEYLDLAKELAQPSPASVLQEASLRSAISRAYYGAFCRARNHLRALSPHLVFPTGAEIHGFVRDRFRSRPELMSKAIAAHLERLRDWRNDADYDDSVPNLQSLCQMALLAADAVMTSLSTL
jgi:uncharacterized protein (UPF0332 family)